MNLWRPFLDSKKRMRKTDDEEYLTEEEFMEVD